MTGFELRIGKRRTGFVVVPDTKWPGMYRVRAPDGGLSDVVNLSRAKDAAVCLACPRGLGGSAVAHWDSRETDTEGPPMRYSDPPATMVAASPLNERVA